MGANARRSESPCASQAPDAHDDVTPADLMGRMGLFRFLDRPPTPPPLEDPQQAVDTAWHQAGYYYEVPPPLPSPPPAASSLATRLAGLARASVLPVLAALVARWFFIPAAPPSGSGAGAYAHDSPAQYKLRQRCAELGALSALFSPPSTRGSILAAVESHLSVHGRAVPLRAAPPSPPLSVLYLGGSVDDLVAELGALRSLPGGAPRLYYEGPVLSECSSPWGASPFDDDELLLGALDAMLAGEDGRHWSDEHAEALERARAMLCFHLSIEKRRALEAGAHSVVDDTFDERSVCGGADDDAPPAAGPAEVAAWVARHAFVALPAAMPRQHRNASKAGLRPRGGYDVVVLGASRAIVVTDAGDYAERAQGAIDDMVLAAGSCDAAPAPPVPSLLEWIHGSLFSQRQQFEVGARARPWTTLAAPFLHASDRRVPPPWDLDFYLGLQRGSGDGDAGPLPVDSYRARGGDGAPASVAEGRSVASVVLLRF